MARIVVMDDDELIRELICQVLGRQGHEVIAEPNGRLGLQQVKAVAPDVVITDMLMPEKEGLETIGELRRQFPNVRIIAISGGGRVSPSDYLAIAKKFGAHRTLGKPFTTEELTQAVAAAIESKGAV